MYIDSIQIRNFRVFEEIDAQFVHPQTDFQALNLPTPKLKNVNLLLGNNGAGKTSMLKSIAIACLGPAAPHASLPVYRLIRRIAANSKSIPPVEASIKAAFTPHPQDHVPVDFIESDIAIVRPGGMDELEIAQWRHPEEKPWHPIYSSENQAFFFVGYSAERIVQRRQNFDEAARQVSSFRRAQRIRSLFDESYPLVPLTGWLPQQAQDPRRSDEIADILNELLRDTGYRFSGKFEFGEYLFSRGALNVPFPALSDGMRAFVGWVGDMLYHVSQTCPPGEKLVDNHGIVMVDEIDLHLHPKWQLSVLPTLSAALPKIQFIVTSHSPLVVGSLEWMNILLMDFENGQTHPERVDTAVHGLDADQILLTPFFGLETTRAGGRGQELKKLSLRARQGDTEAAKELLRKMSEGAEASA